MSIENARIAQYSGTFREHLLTLSRTNPLVRACLVDMTQNRVSELHMLRLLTLSLIDENEALRDELLRQITYRAPTL